MPATTTFADVRLVDPQPLELHEYAKLFPSMDTEDYDAVKNSITSIGMKDAIILHEGKVVDGAHRLRIALDLHLPEVPVRDWDGQESLIEFLLARNLARRQLTPSQKAALAVQIEPLLAQEAKKRQQQHGGTAPGRNKNTCGTNATSDAGRARDQAAALTNASPRYVSDAKQIMEQSPEAFEEIKAGKQTISGAKAKLKAQPARQRKKSVSAAPNRVEEYTAYHLAGHAVMTFLLGMPLAKVSIRHNARQPGKGGRPGKGGSGCRWEHGQASSCEHRLLVALAGLMGQGMLAKAAVRTDRETIRALAKLAAQITLGGGQAMADTGSAAGALTVRWSAFTRKCYVDWLESAVEDIFDVRRVKDAVTALATALVTREELTGDEATALLKAKTPRLIEPSATGPSGQVPSKEKPCESSPAPPAAPRAVRAQRQNSSPKKMSVATPPPKLADAKRNANIARAMCGLF
jgi:hypothetical protein